MNIVQISDTHISHRGGIPNDNFARLARFINQELKPDLVVHSGDVVILNPDIEADRHAARELFDRLDAPVRVLPGNHDVGEPGDRPWAGFATTTERVKAFTDVFGPDHWLETVGDYAAIGINSEILTTGTPEEDEQWAWLAGLPEQVAGRPALVFCHKPFWPPVPGVAEHAVAIPEAARDRLLRALAGVHVVAYGSGHLHHYAVGSFGDAVTVSAPSTAFVVQGHEAMVGPGLVQLGVVEYCGVDGGVQPYFRGVPDLVEGSPLAVDAFVAEVAELGITVEI